MDGKHTSSLAYANGVERIYDPRHNYVAINPPDKVPPPETLPLPTSGMAGQERGAPSASLRRMLAEGDLHDAGTVQVNGKTARRLTGVSDAPVARRFVYDVDPNTFAPVDATIITKHQTVAASRVGLHVSHQVEIAKVIAHFQIKSYERIKPTPKAATLLKLHPQPDTKIYHLPAKIPGALPRSGH
jgi:hypothetical protein